jgi:hypothetical protein
VTTFQALATAWRVGHEVEGAWEAARAQLEAGHGPLVALRAFTEATTNELDDAVALQLDQGLRGLLTTLVGGIDGAALLITHRAVLQEALVAVLDAVTDAGYQAGAWRWQLAAWLHEEGT